MLKRGCMWHLLFKLLDVKHDECLSHILLWSHFYHLTPFTHVLFPFFFFLNKPRSTLKNTKFSSFTNCVELRGERTLPGFHQSPKKAAKVSDFNGRSVLGVDLIWWLQICSTNSTSVLFFCFGLFVSISGKRLAVSGTIPF